MTTREIVALLADTECRVLRFAGLDEALHRRSYGPGKWTGIQILAHLADVDAVFYYRFLKAAAEEGSTIAPFDETVWASELRYEVRPIVLSAAMIRAVHTTVSHHLTVLPSENLQRVSVHPEKGPQTPLRIASTIARHTLHHLGQLDAIREGRTWTLAEKVDYWS
ncbi:MAG TPA: DinB family protein [Candidatus Limnocylindria bacterium]|nr:DinB family protein [Candidatus Limnocylindria bacterium]